jgi:hypothetical protein
MWLVELSNVALADMWVSVAQGPITIWHKAVRYTDRLKASVTFCVTLFANTMASVAPK